MTKAEFLAQLRAALGRLPQDDINQSLDFYAEAIDDRIEDGMSEQDAVAQLGSVEQIAAQIISEAPFAVRTVAKAKSNKTNLVLVIVLLVVLSPVWLPLVISIIALVASLLVAIWAVMFSLWICVLALIVTGLAGIVALFYMTATGHPLSGLLALGGGLACIGLGIFAFFGMLALSKALWRFTKFVALKAKALFVRQDKVSPSNNGGLS